MSKLPEISEYVTAIETPQMLKVPVLKGGRVVKRGDTIIRYTGGFCVVFPFETASKKYAVRCWHAYVADAQERTRRIAETLHQMQLPYFVGFEYIPDGILTNTGVQPIVVMDWVDAHPLKEYISDHLSNSAALRAVANAFLGMVKDLHKHRLSHGDLQHGNILVRNDGSLVLVDYDSMYVPALEGFADDIKGLDGYQHEARRKNEKLSPKADYFSELVIYTSLIALSKLPHLWQELNMEGTDTLLFDVHDIESKGNSEIFNILDGDGELRSLSESLKQFMQCTTIDELSPLEEIIVSPIESISSKWGDNGYRKPVIDNTPTIQRISEGWRNAPPIVKDPPSTESITKKW